MRQSSEQRVTHFEIALLEESRPDVVPAGVVSFCSAGEQHYSTSFFWGPEYLCVLVRCHPTYEVVILPSPPDAVAGDLGANSIQHAFRYYADICAPRRYPAHDTRAIIDHLSASAPPAACSNIRDPSSDPTVEKLRRLVAQFAPELSIYTAFDPILESHSIVIVLDESTWGSLGTDGAGNWIYRTATLHRRAPDWSNATPDDGTTPFVALLATLIEETLDNIVVSIEGEFTTPGRRSVDAELFSERLASAFWVLEDIANGFTQIPLPSMASKVAQMLSDHVCEMNSSVKASRDVLHSEIARVVSEEHDEHVKSVEMMNNDDGS